MISKDPTSAEETLLSLKQFCGSGIRPGPASENPPLDESTVKQLVTVTELDLAARLRATFGQVRATPMIIVRESSQVAGPASFTTYDHVIPALPVG